MLDLLLLGIVCFLARVIVNTLIKGYRQEKTLMSLEFDLRYAVDFYVVEHDGKGKEHPATIKSRQKIMDYWNALDEFLVNFWDSKRASKLRIQFRDDLYRKYGIATKLREAIK